LSNIFHPANENSYAVIGGTVMNGTLLTWMCLASLPTSLHYGYFAMLLVGAACAGASVLKPPPRPLSRNRRRASLNHPSPRPVDRGDGLEGNERSKQSGRRESAGAKEGSFFDPQASTPKL